MGSDLEQHKARTPIVRRAVAGLVLVAAAALAIELVIHVITAIFFVVAAIAVVVAVAWALKTVFW